MEVVSAMISGLRTAGVTVVIIEHTIQALVKIAHGLWASKAPAAYICHPGSPAAFGE